MSNQVIYSIININDHNMFYIGSTNNLTRRLNQHHKSTYNKIHKKYHSKLYKYIRNNDWDNFVFKILCCNFDGNILEKEQHFINLYNPPLNSIRSSILII